MTNKYRECGTCDGYGWVTMTGKQKHSPYPIHDYEFGFACQCENGKKVQQANLIPDYVSAGISGFVRRFIFDGVAK